MLIANPNDEAADVTVRYLPDTGAGEATKTYRVEGRQRLTRNIALEDPALANAAVATHVQATRPVVVERAQYWGQPAWIEAHNSFGITAVAPRWGLAEGRVGGAEAAQTYIMLANAGAETAAVTLTFLRADGTTVVKTFDVEPARRFNVVIVPGPGNMVPGLADESFGARIESTHPITSSARSTAMRTASPGPPGPTPPPPACHKVGGGQAPLRLRWTDVIGVGSQN